jgi:hypothetical protein
MSERRACSLVATDRKMIGHRSRRPPDTSCVPVFASLPINGVASAIATSYCRAPILVEAKPNARGALDFAYDQLAYGRRLRILNIVDDVTRECLAAIPDTSQTGCPRTNDAH